MLITQGVGIKLLCISMFLIASAHYQNANADMTIKVFKKLEKGSKIEKLGLDSYIGGVGKGYLWANSTLKGENQQPLFCFDGDMTTSEFLKLTSNEIKYVQSITQIDNDTPVELVLLTKLKKLYPCSDPQSEK